MTDVRCGAKKFGEIHDGLLEVKCSSKFCGAAPGVVVLHRFDLLTGEELETKRFRDPEPLALKEGSNATDNDPASVRAS